MVEGEREKLRRALGFVDLVLFFVVTGFSMRWVATAAAAGPSALVIWLLACATFYVPLMFCVIELSSRYPQEGGLYVWSQRAFGDFAGFMAGWTYWSCNLPYFPALLYFAAGNAIFIGGTRWQHLSNSSVYFISASLIGLAVATALNVVGLDAGKWLHNLGAVATWVPALILVAIGLLAWTRFGSATPITLASLVPSVNLRDIIFWSTIAFALAGVESAPVMGDEIRDARRNIPRALLLAGALITVSYIVATFCVLLALPREEVSELQGIMQALEKAAGRLGIDGVVPVAAALIAFSGLGGTGAWLAATSRLPFVAGIDRFLPTAFARLHPRWGTPHVALLLQAFVAAIFIFLGQAGTSVKGAYDALVSMSVISYFIPFLFLFGSMIRLQREAAGPEVIRVPGGKPVAIILAGLGFTTTAASILLSAIPPENEPNKGLAVVKVVGLCTLLVALGTAIFWRANSRRKAEIRKW
jgi:amino acid transporter